ncbi:hypothetical protein C2845_PM06G08740 [Panicum miliaceum]|uniref:Uncharacterized protein n=1 Tax=Panicum miliaceum TaxID=4540 RepID=A0A3L6R8G1_PANMI|nr:hypothetical protein C2845_PM06G08740 [Panicum miliaceum]
MDPAPGGSPVHASTEMVAEKRRHAPHASRQDKNVVVRGGPGTLRVDAGGEIADDAAPEKLAAVGRRERGREEEEREGNNSDGRIILTAWHVLFRCQDAVEAEAQTCLEGFRLAAQWIQGPIILVQGMQQQEDRSAHRFVLEEARKTRHGCW